MTNNELHKNLEGIATAISTLGQQLSREKRLREEAEKHAERRFEKINDLWRDCELWRQDFDKAIDREWELRQDRDVWRRKCESWRQDNTEQRNQLQLLEQELETAEEGNRLKLRTIQELRDELSTTQDELADERQGNVDGWCRVRELKAELSRLKSSEQWAVTCEGMHEQWADSVARTLEHDKRHVRTDITYRAVPLAAKEGGPWVLVRRMAYKMYGTTAASGAPGKAARYDTYAAAKRSNNGDFIPVRLSDVQAD